MTIDFQTKPDSLSVHIVFTPQNSTDKALNNLLAGRLQCSLSDPSAVSVDGRDVLTLVVEAD